MKTLNELVSENLKKTIYSFILVFVVMVALGIYFEPEIEHVARSIYAHFGLWGLAVAVFINDCIISPLPGDVVLVIVSKSDLASQWLLVTIFFGAVSALAGFGGYAIGHYLREDNFVRRWLGSNLELMEAKFSKFGSYVVVLGALTPLPFSLSCWVAGMMKYPKRKLIFPVLLRIPRFLVVYLLLAKADFVSNLLRALHQP